MKGLTNIGNTCYLNSGLQMLLQNIDLCKLVIKYKDYSNTLKILSDFIFEYYNDNNDPISPKKIKKLLQEYNDIFVGYDQQDSTEFILYLLDLIETEIIKVNKDSHEMKDIFGVQLNIRIKCKLKTCLTVYNNKELTSVLMLNIGPELKTLDDIYNYMKSADRLDNDNKYFCEKCQANRIASKRTSVDLWPSHLFIWLKRFNQIGRHIIKNNNHIGIPLTWRHVYTLQGAVCHSGSLNGGHYVYVGRNTNKWFIFNDSTIAEINSTDELFRILGSAYWIYYKKETLIIS